MWSFVIHGALGSSCSLWPFLIAVAFLVNRCRLLQELREQAVASLVLVAFAYNDAVPPIPASGSEPLCMRSPALEAYNDIVTVLLGVMRCESSLETVAQACVGVQQFCKSWGAGALVRHHEAIMTTLLVILNERAACQLQADEDGSEGEPEPLPAGGGGRRGRALAAAALAASSPESSLSAVPLPAPFVMPGTPEAVAAATRVNVHAAALLKDAGGSHGHSHGGVACHGHGHHGTHGHAVVEAEEGSEDDVVEHDDVLIDEAVDAVASVAAALGSAFAPYLPAAMFAVLRFLSPRRSVTDRIMGVGLVADLARWTGEAFAPFVAASAPLVIAGLSATGQPGLQRNAAYAVGQLLACVSVASRPFAGQFLAGLQPLFAVRRGDSESEHMIDNVASALARGALAFPDLVPSAIAIPALASKLPIVADCEEASPVLRYLLQELHRRTPAAVAALPQIVVGCASALLPGSGVSAQVRDGEIAPGLRHYLRIGGADAHAAVAAAVAALPSEQHRSAVAAALQGVS
jgi:hypothetical protein